MNNTPRVSVVISFLNAERFLEEAIESVFAQTFKSWELLLVDDGSSDSGTSIARRYAEQHPGLVRYLDHDNHRNRGLPVSRNLGIRSAIGDYIALLDSDDAWLPCKLEQQVAILDSHPGVAMVHGASQYWHSWAGNSAEQLQDYVQMPGIPANRIYERPALLKLHVSGQACPPCPSDMLCRRESILNLGGFEESFIGSLYAYEDQAFITKVYSNLPVFVSDVCWDRYRRHSDSLCARMTRAGQAQAARAFYLNWLAEYLSSQSLFDGGIREWVRRDLWRNRHPALCRLLRVGPALVRRVKGSWKALQREFGVRLPVLLYHHVGPHRPGIVPGLTVSPQSFEAHVRWLARRGYTGIRPADWLRWRKEGNGLPEKPVLFTFDDAYADLVEHALPVLRRYGFGAAVYVVTGHVGGTNAWDEALGFSPLRLMTAEQIRDWAAQGIEFGAHSRTHVDLTTLSTAELRDEVVGSGKDLESILGSRVTSFAYPYGFHNPAVDGCVCEAFDLALIVDPKIKGMNFLATEPHLLRRTLVPASDSVADIECRVRWGYSPIERLRNRLRLRSRFKNAIFSIVGRREPEK